MNQMEQLWEFMQEDLKADRIAASMKHSSARQNAEKARDLYFEQQKLAKQMTEQVAAQADRKDAVKDAVRRCNEQLNALSQKLQDPPTDLEEIRALIAEADRYRKTIHDYEQELKRLGQQSVENAGRVQKIGIAAAQAKNDFEKYKKEYQAEMDRDSAGKKEELEKARAAAKELAAQVSQQLMDEYQSIKKHIYPPMSRLVNGACSGCNTAQPSALLAKINSGADVVECETCGRMLIK